MTGRILVATDGSKISERAVAFAAELSDRLERDLSILHVHLHMRPSAELTRLAEAEHLLDHVTRMKRFEDLAAMTSLGAFHDATSDEIQRANVIEAIGTEILERARLDAEEAGGRNVRCHIAAGDFADEILDTAEADDAEMIVMGRRGLGRARELLVGSVTQKVLHATDRTVVVVR